MTTNTSTSISGNSPLDTQQTAVLLAALTYSSDPQTDIATYLPGWSIVWNGTQSYDGNYAFIALDPAATTYALAIRGSLPPFDVFNNWNAFANWVLEDLDVVTRVSWPYAATSNPLISNGANTAFTNMQQMVDQLGSGLSIYEYLKANAVQPDNGKQVLITGHSLGGNIANVYASYFVTALAGDGYPAFNDSTSLVTFAAPAPGNADFATDLDAKITNAWHYENDQDIVPKFPHYSTVLLVGFMYIGGPSAKEITTTLDGVTVSLRDAFMTLAGILLAYGYQQQGRNYTVFSNPIDSAFTQNTLTDFFSQAGAQHEVVNYANNLNVVLPLPLVAESRMV